jgi:molybdate transport system regulatory protein
MARLRISIVFESDARIGSRQGHLLESIRYTGSISAAARDIGMTYKRAALLLDSIEPVVIAAPGGHGSDDLTAHRAARTPDKKFIR